MKDNLVEGLKKDVAERFKEWVEINSPIPGHMVEETSEKRIELLMDTFHEAEEDVPPGYQMASYEDLMEGYVAMEQFIREYIIALDRLRKEK